MKEVFMHDPQTQTAFSKNIEYCREHIYKITYRDVTNYISVPESTMITYDTKGVSCLITIAKQIAELYCTTIERLCDYEISYDIEEILKLQIDFINRIGGMPTKLYKEKVLDEFLPRRCVSKLDICEYLGKEIFPDIIADIHKFNKFVKIERDFSIVKNISKNFHDLHENLKIGYRAIRKITNISIGNLTRIEQGYEPMLATILVLCDYFGITISQMLSENPDFDYEKIKKEISKKTKLKDIWNGIPLSCMNRRTRINASLLMDNEIEIYVNKWFSKIKD